MDDEGLFASRYRNVRLIGKGGMAAVYEVVDETTGNRVALKQLLPEQAKRRPAALLFQREYNTLAQLSHPLVIRAFDYGVEADTPYYTMELLSGENLRHLAPLPWKEVASLVRDVASALALVHSRHLVHRDVTPRNVCRTPDRRAKLIDFGTLTPMGPARNVMGTPPFLSPESLEEQPLDARADLFSLGAVAYYLLCGEHAYPARRIAELGHVWRRPIRPPSSRATDVPPALDALVLSLINLNPLARPGSAAEVFDRLTAIADLPKAEAPETARAYFLTPALVAREDATQRFRRRLLRAERGRGSAVLVEAPSGCGRSRLLASFLLEAKLRGMVAIRADAEAGRGEAFGVVRELSRSLQESEPVLAQELFDEFPDLVTVMGPDAAGDGGEIDPNDWIPLTRKFSDWFVRLAGKRSTVIGVDDLDECDGPSAAVLATIAAGAADEPLLVVTTARNGSKVPHTERMRHAGGSIALVPFRPADTRALMTAVFGDAPHTEAIADWVHRLSEGNPRTAFELAQHLVDRGLARYHEGGWILPSSFEGLNLPESVDQALDARVAALGPDARRLAEALALTSDGDPLLLNEFPALTDGKLGALFGALNELVSASVLIASGGTYAFVHREVKEAVWRGIPRDRLTEIHRSIANAYASGLDRVSMLAAHHLFAAGDRTEAFRVAVEAVNERTDYFARGNSFIRTPAGAETVEALLEWGRAHAMPAKDLSLIARAVLQLASVGDARLVRHAPLILEGLERDSGLVYWKDFANVTDPVARVQACVGEAYAQYGSALDREQRLDPAAAIQELATAAAMTTGVYARSADVASTAALDALIAPLRPLSPALEVVGGVVNYAADALRGYYTRDKRLRVVEQTKVPVPGIDELSRVGIHLLGLYYLALEDALQGYASADEFVAPLDGHPAYAPLAWQARMLSHYYRGDEKEAALCRRRRDLAMTGRLDIDGHIETSALYEASVYATLGNLMALKNLLPTLEELSKVRPGWRPFAYLARGNCHFLRGEHAKAVEEYERGLSLEGIPESHTARVLISIKLFRSLVFVGRAEEARARAAAILERYAGSPLQALYVDQLEFALAGSECSLGRTAEGLARAAAVIDRAEKRGLSGVLLVDFLAEQGVMAQAAGEVAAFDAIVKRVGSFAAKTDSAAFASRYSRLLQLGQTSHFDAMPGIPDPLPGDGPYTTLGGDVRTQLDLCRGPAERATRALRLLMEYSAAGQGYLYVHEESGFRLVAGVPDTTPTTEVEDAVHGWHRMALDAEQTTRTSSRSQPLTIGAESAFEIVGLITTMSGEVLLAGVAALKGLHGGVKPIPSAVVAAVGDGLLRAGDAARARGLGTAVRATTDR